MSCFASPLSELQIELSTVCNALCLGCVRTDQLNFNSSKSFIPNKKFLDLNLLFDRITEAGDHHLKKIEFCGNIDEPLLHPGFLGLLKRLSEWNKNLEISIHTNGSSRNEAYFQQLAELLNGFDAKHELRFSIDGLGDTNSIYRQNTRFDRIIANAKSFINAGGTATWQYIVFPWNEHQSDEAKQRASEMGFKKFVLRKDRSLDDETMDRFRRKEEFRDLKSEQKFKDFKPAKFSKFDELPIECYFKKFNMMFISWDGKLWPCCFTANIYFESDTSKIEKFEDNFFGSFDRNFNDLAHNSLADILRHPIYERLLVEGWENSIEDKSNPKLWRCVEKCRSSLEKKAPLKRVEL